MPLVQLLARQLQLVQALELLVKARRHSVKAEQCATPGSCYGTSRIAIAAVQSSPSYVYNEHQSAPSIEPIDRTRRASLS